MTGRRATCRGGHGQPAVVALARYWLSIFPVAHAEVEGWRRRAARIPDPVLRALACDTVEGERRNAESAAIFAVLAPPSQRAAVARLLVTYQLMYDYLDTLSEQPAGDPLANGRQLHRALVTPLTPGVAPPDYFAHHPGADDGGYLAALAWACALRFARLPSGAVVADGLRRTIALSSESQSRNHAELLGRDAALASWAQQATPPAIRLAWWETAAAAGSSLATHALLAAAADPRLSAAGAARIEDAYWPWINALNTLLESLADQADDAVTGNHSYVGHYRSGAAMAHQLGTIAGEAARATAGLPRSREHRTIVAGMAAFYLAAPSARAPAARPAAAAVRRELGAAVVVLTAMLRLRERSSRR